jgi:hypothetical protein
MAPLNGAEELSVGADGRFKFPKALTRGSTYAVTVKTQPSSPVKQTCTVGQGTGSANTPINNVAVTCATNSYAVGGTVSGLSGKKPLLVLESTEEVEIAKNGNSSFPTSVRRCGDYRVASQTRPRFAITPSTPHRTATP